MSDKRYSVWRRDWKPAENMAVNLTYERALELCEAIRKDDWRNATVMTTSNTIDHVIWENGWGWEREYFRGRLVARRWVYRTEWVKRGRD